MGVQSGLTAKSESCSVNRVGTGLNSDIDDRAGFPTVLSSRVLLGFEFIDSVDR